MKENSFITIKSVKTNSKKVILIDDELNFKSKYSHLKPVISTLSQKKLIHIALNDSSWQIRRLALKHIKDINTVVSIAFNDKSHNVRKYFLNLLNTPSLERIALSDPSEKVRRMAIDYIFNVLTNHIAENDPSMIAKFKDFDKIKKYDILMQTLLKENLGIQTVKDAIERIDDEDFLIEVYQKRYVDEIRYLIIDNLKSPENLFKIYDSSQWRFREKIIEKLESQEILFKAFKLEKDDGLKNMLMEKIILESSLRNIVLDDDSNEFKRKAIEKIFNDEFLLDIINGDYDDNVKISAVKNITNEKFSAEIFNDSNFFNDLRLEALKNITDDDKLIGIIKNTQDTSQQMICISNIHNQDFIRDFALKHQNWKIRSVAVSKIDDNDLLFDVAQNDSCWFLRKLAVLKIRSEKKRFQLLENEDNRQVLEAIVNSIKNPELLFDVLKSGYTSYINLNSINNLNNEEILTHIALNHEIISHRFNAIDLLKNKDTLKHIVLKDPYLEVKNRALVKNHEDIEADERTGIDLLFKRKYWNYVPELRFIDEDVFYEYLLGINILVTVFVNQKIIEKVMSHVFKKSYLMNLALNAPNDYVRFEAIKSKNFNLDWIDEDEMIKSLDTLGKSRKNYGNLADEILEKISDESKLTDYIINHKYRKYYNDPIVFSAINHVTDEECLFRIANEINVPTAIKNIAVEKITNPEMLEEIVMNHPNVYTRNSAIKNIHDENILKYLALNDPSHIIRKSAVMWRGYKKEYSKKEDMQKSIENEEILHEIVLKSEDMKVRWIAVNLIKSPKLLLDIAKKSRDVKIRHHIIKTIHNQNELIDFALNDSSRCVRKAAIENLEESNLIAIFDEIKDWYIRNSALKLITEEGLGLDDSNWHVRATAVSKITDDETLKEIALKDSNINIRKQAISKIKSIEVLNEIKDETIHYTTPGIVEENLRRQSHDR